MTFTVWTLLLWERSGDTVSVFPSEAAAKAHLHSIVMANWSRVFPDFAPPSNREEAIATYFDKASDTGAFIEPHQVTMKPDLAQAA